MKRYYLDKIGVNDRWDTLYEDDKERMKKLKKQQKKYGFDSRECFSLYTTFFEWLYERLKKYLEDASEAVDLTFHKWDYNGEQKTQKELIEQAINLLEEYLTKYKKVHDFEEENRLYEKAEEAAKIFIMILPGMWW